ncbi:hypothetical protein PF004_g30843 [Phytophthora fragariae]|uniref:Protein kinase domain-containing protein n=1 Tax=Phytophthora fragariae TaxID=53985 RepID=A0A6G0MAU1_9STRA|nr:hypothetical protein PF004_g30843 [Phytophthora fragariae]
MGEGTELLEAARAGELERVKALVEQDTNADKDNALRWAAREGSLDVVQYLVEHGAVVNAKDYLGDTALMRAAEGGHTTVVQFLTDGCKADVKASNKNGYTALVWAARCGQDEVVRYLAERRGVEVDARDKNGYTALMKVCKGGNIKVLRALAAAGADVNGSDDFGYTALMIASGCGHIDIVRFLVEECHVVVNSRNNRGKTAVRVASDCGNGDVERYLTPFLLHSPPSYVSAATSTAENDVLETQTMSIPPSEVEPIDFSTSSSIGPNYHRVKWLEADACVKLLRPDSDHSSLEKEVHLWQGLRHPNMMNFYGVCDSVPQLQLFVCEYASKGTLIDHVKLDSVERSSVWRYLHEAAVGLAYLHRQGIVHGDLRCSNILIGNDGIAKLCNVELSGLLEKSSDASAGANGFVRWQGPEVLRGEKLSFQSDVYSLGMCILKL